MSCFGSVVCRTSCSVHFNCAHQQLCQVSTPITKAWQVTPSFNVVLLGSVSGCQAEAQTWRRVLLKGPAWASSDSEVGRWVGTGF